MSGPLGSGAPDGPEAPDAADAHETAAAAAIRERSELEIRWRQARNVPPPIVRAIVADLGLAIVGGLLLLAWDVVSGGAGLGAFVLYIAVVAGAGSLLTYLWAPLPSGASGVRRRTPWAAMLGLFAAFPVVYIVLVIAFQVIRPLL
ncbi:MAG: hypothetical protein ACHQ15_06155 [Candidatus Limnocylindrales bacterium]